MHDNTLSRDRIPAAAHAAQGGYPTVLDDGLQAAEKGLSLGSAVFGGSATGAAISAALTAPVLTEFENRGGELVVVSHNILGGPPMTASGAGIVTLCATVVLGCAAAMLREIIAARKPKPRSTLIGR
jgi:hypothetical protein